jgi:hypothetical protein
LEQSSLLAALDNYRDAHAILERLAKADPNNPNKQHELALILGKIATVETRQGERQRALSGLERGREIITRLQLTPSGIATLPRDLAWFNERIARLNE